MKTQSIPFNTYIHTTQGIQKDFTGHTRGRLHTGIYNGNAYRDSVRVDFYGENTDTETLLRGNAKGTQGKKYGTMEQPEKDTWLKTHKTM